MLKKISTFAIALLLMGGLTIPAAADGLPTREARRSVFNPFSVRPSVRPVVRFSPFSWIGGRPTGNPESTQTTPLRPAPREEVPAIAPQPGSALEAADEESLEEDDQPAPISSMGGDEPPVRSPFRPPLRGPF